MPLPIPDGSVVITPTQMYGQIVDLTDAVRELKGVVDPAISDVRKDLTDHETRLRRLESYGPADMPVRVAALEARKFVPPTALWSAFALALTALSVLAAFLAVKGG